MVGRPPNRAKARPRILPVPSAQAAGKAKDLSAVLRYSIWSSLLGTLLEQPLDRDEEWNGEDE